MSILQEALHRKKQQEFLRQEHKKKKVLHDIKEMFLYAFSLLEMSEEKPIIEKLVNIVDKIMDEDLDYNVELLE